MHLSENSMASIDIATAVLSAEAQMSLAERKFG